MSNFLIPIDESQSQSLEEFKELSSGNDYLPYIGLGQGLSKAVQNEQCKLGNWYICENQSVTDLGHDCTVIPIVFRGRAMDSSGDNTLFSFDPKSDVYKDIVQRSGVANSGCQYGPEFLVYCPQFQTFATMFFGSKTMRNSAGAFRGHINQHVTLAATKITKGKLSWYGPVFKRNAEPPESLPDAKTTSTIVAAFLDPPKDTVEMAPQAEGGGRDV